MHVIHQFPKHTHTLLSHKWDTGDNYKDLRLFWETSSVNLWRMGVIVRIRVLPAVPSAQKQHTPISFLDTWSLRFQTNRVHQAELTLKGRQSMLDRTSTERLKKEKCCEIHFIKKNRNRKQTQASKNSLFAHTVEHHVTASTGKMWGKKLIEKAWERWFHYVPSRLGKRSTHPYSTAALDYTHHEDSPEMPHQWYSRDGWNRLPFM